VDHPAITALLVRYCDLMDAGDWDAVGALFPDGALVAPDGAELARGPRAVSDFYAALVEIHDGSPRTKHLVLNTVVEDQDDGTSIVRSSYLVLQELDGVVQPIITGRYIDRVAGGVFLERRFFVDLAGDLSRHLRA
jgi:3-phenylpropionate/cinnamic acid dioxygenase small subunit